METKHYDEKKRILTLIKGKQVSTNGTDVSMKHHKSIKKGKEASTKHHKKEEAKKVPENIMTQTNS